MASVQTACDLHSSQCNVYTSSLDHYSSSNMTERHENATIFAKPISMIKYYSSDFWIENADPTTKQFFGMETPWIFLSIGLAIIIFCKFLGPYLMKNRKAKDLRPLMIITNGFAFGTYTGGVVIALGGTGFQGCFDCSAYKPETNDLINITIKYLGYCLVWSKIYDFIRPVLAVLAKKQHQVTWLQLLHLECALFLCWAGMKIHPGGIFIPVGVVDTIYQSFAYGYLVMKASSDEMKPSDRVKPFLLYLRVISVFLVFLHQSYFLTQKNCYTVELRLFAATYTLLLVFLYPIDYYIRQGKSKAAKLDANHNEKDQ